MVPGSRRKSHPSKRVDVRQGRKRHRETNKITFWHTPDELMFVSSELRKFGFNPLLIASVMSAEPDAIRELSVQLTEKIGKAKSLSKRETHLVRRGLVVPDRLVDWLIVLMLEALSKKHRPYIPPDLVALVKKRLGGSKTQYERGAKAAAMRDSAIEIAGKLLAQGIRPSFRIVGEVLKVEASTVKRWFPSNDFMQQAELAKRMYDDQGNPRPPPPIPKVPPVLRKK
jgi:hypothetical protein